MTGTPDVIFVHGYWLSEEKNQTILSLRSELVVQAVAEVFKQSTSKPFIILTAGHIWGEKYPSVADLMKKQLLQLGTPENRIIVQDIAINTKDELAVFLSLQEKYHWKHVVDVAFAKHFWTIPLLYPKKKDFEVNFMSVENTLPNNQQLSKLTHSIYESNYFFYQLTIRIVLFFDNNYTWLGKKSHTDRQKKRGFGLISFLPADKYNL